ncbi:MAG: cupin domain-containing protein [Chloroflexota bacterium]|nr:cupin domain-containing protein [Chloroflexota bacterium]
MYFHNPSTRDTKELVPGIFARTFWGDKMLVAVFDLDPNTHMPSHTHPHEQAGTVIAGKIELTIGAETKTLQPGDVYIIPSGVEHEAKTFDQPVKVIDVFSPVREEYKW